jgi:hypothetical protein
MVGLDDIGVDEVGDQFGFADEILDELFLVGVVLADDLHGHALDKVARAMLLGFVHDAHAPFEDLADDLVSEIALDSEQRCHRGHVGELPGQVKPLLVFGPEQNRIVKKAIFSLRGLPQRF